MTYEQFTQALQIATPWVVVAAITALILLALVLTFCLREVMRESCQDLDTLVMYRDIIRYQAIGAELPPVHQMVYDDIALDPVSGPVERALVAAARGESEPW